MIPSTGILTIDLAAIQSNWLYIVSRIKNTECAAVIKANAYGVGDEEVASALYKVGCRTFYLAALEEAEALRLLLPEDTKLYVFGGVRAGSESEFQKLNLIPVLFTLNDIYRWSSFCASIKKTLPCAIKFDTGMSRLGLSDRELSDFLACVPELPWLNPVLFMSHLACADEPCHPLNSLQLERFQAAVEKIKMYFPTIKLSLANSSGTFLGDDYHFDMVRIGAALYGINPQPSKPNPLSQTIKLKLPVLQIRAVEDSVLVGYNAEGVAGPNMRLAVVAGGYADGVHRTLGVSPKGIIDGILVSAIGRVSMDTTVFDISAIASSPEFIQVINDERTLDIIMKENKFLGYEVLTSLGRRYLRQYRAIMG